MLKVIVHSRREYDGYSVENVALETMPGFFCTGNLYRPLKQDRPGPGILCPHGHFKPLGRMRPEQQIRCAQFAKNDDRCRGPYNYAGYGAIYMR
jgi:hypothetical protein